jgi:hypothetical protein
LTVVVAGVTVEIILVLVLQVAAGMLLGELALLAVEAADRRRRRLQEERLRRLRGGTHSRKP